jgi:hypothetical protein
VQLLCSQVGDAGGAVRVHARPDQPQPEQRQPAVAELEQRVWALLDDLQRQTHAVAFGIDRAPTLAKGVC